MLATLRRSMISFLEAGPRNAQGQAFSLPSAKIRKADFFGMEL